MKSNFLNLNTKLSNFLKGVVYWFLTYRLILILKRLCKFLTNAYKHTIIPVLIFWNFEISYCRSNSLQIKRNLLFIITKLAYELPHELLKYFRFRVLQNLEFQGKSQTWMEKYLLFRSKVLALKFSNLVQLCWLPLLCSKCFAGIIEQWGI